MEVNSCLKECLVILSKQVKVSVIDPRSNLFTNTLPGKCKAAVKIKGNVEGVTTFSGNTDFLLMTKRRRRRRKRR